MTFTTTKKTETKRYVTLLVFVFVYPPVTFTATLLEGFVLTHLWRWFAMPFGLPAIALWHAAGLSALLTLLTFPGSAPLAKDLTTTDKVAHVIALGYFRPLFALGVGAFIHWMMTP